MKNFRKYAFTVTAIMAAFMASAYAAAGDVKAIRVLAEQIIPSGTTLTIQATAVTVSGTVSTTGTISGTRVYGRDISATNKITTKDISATGNISAANFIGNGSLLTGLNTTGTLYGVSYITASGIYNKPTDVTKLLVYVAGAGGGGGGIQSGSGANPAQEGSSGGATSFGGITANGGGGGAAWNNSSAPVPGPSGGGASGGQINLTGQGAPGGVNAIGTRDGGGTAVNTTIGAPGGLAVAYITAPDNAYTVTIGGAGAAGANARGGSPGWVIVYEYK